MPKQYRSAMASGDSAASEPGYAGYVSGYMSFEASEQQAGGAHGYPQDSSILGLAAGSESPAYYEDGGSESPDSDYVDGSESPAYYAEGGSESPDSDYVDGSESPAPYLDGQAPAVQGDGAAPAFYEQDEQSRRDQVAARAPESRKAWHADVRAHAKDGLVATPLVEHYLGEEHNLNDPQYLPNQVSGRAVSGTHYADEASEFATSMEGGSLSKGGQTLDSRAAKALWRKDKHQRLNFALDAAGGLYTADVRREFMGSHNEETGLSERNNHSSMLGGGDAAAAGTLRVARGQVEEVGDGSGHYRPGVAQTQSAVSHFIDKGVMDEERSSVRLSAKNDSPEILMSAREMMAYAPMMAEARAAHGRDPSDGSALHRPEEEIRKHHGRKNAMHAQLLSKPPEQHLKPEVIDNEYED